jgi:ribosomal protein L20
MKDLKDKNILLNRKMLSLIADERPETFARFLAKVK